MLPPIQSFFSCQTFSSLSALLPFFHPIQAFCSCLSLRCRDVGTCVLIWVSFLKLVRQQELAIDLFNGFIFFFNSIELYSFALSKLRKTHRDLIPIDNQFMGLPI